jgi:hypothetical protein
LVATVRQVLHRELLNEQAPGALGPEQPVAAAELPEVQVWLGDPAPPFGPPVGEGQLPRRGRPAGALRGVKPLPGGAEDILLS